MVMNPIKIMGWFKSLIFTKSGIYYNIAKYFVQVRLETIETEYQALELSTIPTDNIKKLKYCGLYTWILNSSDESARDFLAKESNNHHQSGPLDWELVTTRILRQVKQVIRCAQNMIHAL